MSQILKHSFEAVSLLTTDNGMLEVTIIPAMNQPDWVIPTRLILSVDDYHERVWTYLWSQQEESQQEESQQEVAVFHLTPHEQPVDKMIVLEGNTDVHRFALQTAGVLRQMSVRISDVKDTELPKQYLEDSGAESRFSGNNDVDDKVEEYFSENSVISYTFQTVIIEDATYLVPDLDKIAHQLIDLDG